MNQNKMQLMKKIYETGLALDDTVLFLDTHPCDEEAAAYYDSMRKVYRKAVKDYEAVFGPLTVEAASTCGQWSWIQEPWPWEMEGC